MNEKKVHSTSRKPLWPRPKNVWVISLFLLIQITPLFPTGPAVPYNRNYKQKYDYFKRQLKKVPVPSGKFEMKVRRKFVLEDSFKVPF